MKFVVMPKMIDYRSNQMGRVSKVVGVGRGNALWKQHKLTLKKELDHHFFQKQRLSVPPVPNVRELFFFFCEYFLWFLHHLLALKEGDIFQILARKDWGDQNELCWKLAITTAKRHPIPCHSFVNKL